MMKHNIKYVISLVFMLLLTQSTWADPTVTVIKKLNGATVTTTSPGEVGDPAIANGKCTLTVTPAQGYYVTKDKITAYSVVAGNVAQTPRRSPNLDNDPIEVRNAGTNTDPSGVTTYELTMPTDGSDVEVTVDFQSRTSLTADMVTLSKESFEYNGENQKPEITVKNGTVPLTENTDYTLTNEGGVNVADVCEVIVTGKGVYQGEVSKSFAITRAAITPTVTLTGWTYGAAANTPSVSGNPGNGAVTYTYKDAEDEEAEFSERVPTYVGSYIIKATVAETANYLSGEAQATFNIVNRTLAANEVTFHNNWATYYSADGDVELPEGIGAFVATGISDGVVTVSQIKNIPEGEAVLLNNATETAGTVAFDPEEDTNLLEHAPKDISTSTGNALFYGLYNGEMWRVTGTIPAGKNYIKLFIGMNNEPQAPNLTIVIEGESSTTGVETVHGSQFMVNDYYDLSGRKLSGKPSKKGLYIHNGKKVVVNNK